MDRKTEAALNKQLNAEAYSSYLYLAMSAYFESENLRGFAHWMRVQAGEEWMHAMKFYDHIRARLGRVELAAISAPPREWKSPLAAFEEAFKHEQMVSGLIHGLVDLATKSKDHATANFLQWFVSEQVEEEAQTDEIVQKLNQMRDAPAGLFIVDRELAQRKD